VYPYDEFGSLSSIFTLPYARHLIVLLSLFAVISIFLLDKKSELYRRIHT